MWKISLLWVGWQLKRFPYSLTEEQDNPLLDIHLFLQKLALWWQSQAQQTGTLCPAQSRTPLSNTLGRDCVAGAKESPPQWDLSGEVKSSPGNINSCASVKGTCWFNTFLSPGEHSSIINGLLLMQNDNALRCSTINARICGLGTDFNYPRNIFSLCKRDLV